MVNSISFEEFYKKELSELLPAFEKQRISVKNKEIAGYGLIGISFLLFIIAVSTHSSLSAILAFISFLTGAIFAVFAYGERKKYVSSFKEGVIRKVIAFIDPNMHYGPDRHISKTDYKESGLFLGSVDDYKGDDYMEGIKDKTHFCFSELHTSREEGSGKSRRKVTIFKGLFFIADFNKNFQGRTYVWSESNPQLNFITKLFSSEAWNLEKVLLESTLFESRFIVYSTDQVEARYILTPSMMERLVKLEQMMGRGISFSFVSTNIYVAIPIKDKLFEPKVHTRNNFQSVGDYYNTIHIVFDIIDELKLNDRLWGKE